MNTQDDTSTPPEAPAVTMAQRLGSAPLIQGGSLPAIDVNEPNINKMARSICLNMPPNRIFRRDDTYLTVQQAAKPNAEGVYSVTLREMTARRLCSYLGDYLIFQKGSGDKAKRVSLSKELAEKILASDEFYDLTPELEMVIPVRLPVWAPGKGGKRVVTLAPVGYDAERRIYTAETLNYTRGEKGYKAEKLVQVWNRLMYTFPWGPESEAEERQVWSLGGTVQQGPCPSTNRSACCVLALMLGQYCRLLIDDLMPIGIINANQQGSGKSLLAWLCVAPVWGMAAGTATPKNDDEMVKSIYTALLARTPYHMMDDIPGLNNNTLNMVATSNKVAGRKLGGLDMFEAKNYLQLFATGNSISTTADVERRSLICDLFLATDALHREFATTLTKKSLAAPGMRADLLRFMAAMVNNWSAAGCPEKVPGSAKPTFETYARVVGSIMVHNGFVNPFASRKYDGAGGDLIGRTIERFLAFVVAQHMETFKSKTFPVKELVELAEANDYLQTITGGSRSPAHSMGKRLEAYRGKKLRDEQGRLYEFSKREEAGRSAYTFTIID